MKPIVIKNAHLHNLKGIDISIPKDKLVVVTGISGSGKSSLVFDILFEAGRRSYLQSIGALTGLGADPGYDEITGLRPAVAVKQGVTRQSNPRSVVGTRTGILHYLSVLYANYHNRFSSIEEAVTSSCFSSNSPLGMCLHCEGRGYLYDLDLSVLIPDPSTTLPQMYSNAGAEKSFKYMLKRIPEKFGVDLSEPFLHWPKAVQNLVLYGQNPGGAQRVGLDTQLKARLNRGRDVGRALVLSQCSHCDGYRISDEAASIELHGKHIGELAMMSIQQLQVHMRSVSKYYQRTKTLFPDLPLLQQTIDKIEQLVAVKLDYLTLYRPVPTLSGGEQQRLFLMSYLTSNMEALLYIFDEPTAGLHESEKQELLNRLRQLKNQGNSVIVVEHDTQTIRSAEHIIDIGPGAGDSGGELVFQGSYNKFLRSRQSISAGYLAVPKQALVDRKLNKVSIRTPSLKLKKVKTNNLKTVNVSIPLRALIGVAGVSGSGKSSLISDTLVPAVQQVLSDPDHAVTDEQSTTDQLSIDQINPSPQFGELSGTELIARCIEVGQEPIGRHINSNPASYLGIWDRIRRHYAGLPLARQRRMKPGHFSFNAAGACEHCQGSGRHRMWLGGTTVSYPCQGCKGQRYKQEILEIRYQGINISELLSLPASEVLSIFKEDKPISRVLGVLDRTGMGYIRLGQPSSTLSGGEAQRIKLAKEIGRVSHKVSKEKKWVKGSLYVLDEPTTGLSPHDTARLLSLCDELVGYGHTVVIIEHDSTVLSHCDWLIELGPGSGAEGGKIIAKGSPATVAANDRSVLGPWLNAGISNA